jgi:Family of unknown function (DUF6281)
MRALTLLLAAVVGAPLLVACSSDMGTCLGPIQVAGPVTQVASLDGPPPPVNQPPDGACPIEVEFDGRPYENTNSLNAGRDGWALSEADVTPLGHATRATGGWTYVDDSVFAIRGVDPLFAIAMHDRSPAGYFVLVKNRDHWPDALCAFLVKRPSDASVCPGLSPSPGGSGRTGSRTGP